MADNAKGAKDAKLDAQSLDRIAKACRPFLTLVLDEQQLARVDNANVKCSMAPTSINERRVVMFHTYRPGDVTNFKKVTGEDGEVTEVPETSTDYTLLVSPAGTAFERTLGYLKGAIKVGHDCNAKTDACQQAGTDLGFADMLPHSLALVEGFDTTDYTAVSEKAGKIGTVVTHRKKVKQPTRQVKIGCECVKANGKRVHFRVDFKMRDIFVGSYHGDGVALEDGGRGGCGAQFEEIAVKSSTLVGEDMAAAA